MTSSTEEEPAPSQRFDLPRSALSLLQDASAAAMKVASQQQAAVTAAGRLLEKTARREGMVWVAGDAADEHQRRLEAAGHRAVSMVDPTRLPRNLRAGDLLLVTAVGDAPSSLLSEAREQGLHTIALVGQHAPQAEAEVVISVECADLQATELTHDFIMTALCAQTVDWDSAESAA